MPLDSAALALPLFSTNLSQWSRQDGTPGSDTYATSGNASFVPADSDFGGALEIQKTESLQRLRAMVKTPLFPGRYLRIRARIKVVTGAFPTVRIAGWAGRANGSHLTGVTEIGPEVVLSHYGRVVEVSAVVGSGARAGVDMVWGAEADHGYFGIDLTGPTGGVVRLDDLEVEDVSGLFLRDLANVVDVRDFGARGDGTSDDRAAFIAADAAAAGREILVPSGVYHVASSLTLESRLRLQGTLSMPRAAVLSLTTQYDLATYVRAFGSEELGLKKALQALMNGVDHTELDMGGRSIALTGPLDLHHAVATQSRSTKRRVLRNGQLFAEGDTAWQPASVTTQAQYSPTQPNLLTNVQNIGAIEVGSRVSGAGVGREVYVRAVNVAAGQLTLSEPLYGALGTQAYGFTRYRYMLDFSGFTKISNFILRDVEFECQGKASGVMLAPVGRLFQITDCSIYKPGHRGITSIGTGCQGMRIDRCAFHTNEGPMPAQNRQSIVLNTNGNDVKLRDNWASNFRHFAVMSGGSNVISGNHFFQGDTEPDGVRLAGIVLANNNPLSTITGNYVDNSFIEWTNEHAPYPDHTSGFSFAALTISDNVFLCGDVAEWFAFIVVKPYGTGHFLQGLNITANSFRSLGDKITRAERVDTSFADLNYGRFRDILIEGNSFNNVQYGMVNPVMAEHTQSTAAQAWMVDSRPYLAFGARARRVESVVARAALRDTNNKIVQEVPWLDYEQGAGGAFVRVNWSKPLRGKVDLKIRMDN